MKSENAEKLIRGLALIGQAYFDELGMEIPEPGNDIHHTIAGIYRVFDRTGKIVSAEEADKWLCEDAEKCSTAEWGQEKNEQSHVERCIDAAIGLSWREKSRLPIPSRYDDVGID